MDSTNVSAIISGILAVAGAFGVGAKWLLNRMDRNTKAAADWQETERKKLETLFTAQIAGLERQMVAQDKHIDSQNEEIRHMRTELTSYVRHVGVLEGLLKANGIEAPAFLKTVI